MCLRLGYPVQADCQCLHAACNRGRGRGRARAERASSWGDDPCRHQVYHRFKQFSSAHCTLLLQEEEASSQTGTVAVKGRYACAPVDEPRVQQMYVQIKRNCKESSLPAATMCVRAPKCVSRFPAASVHSPLHVTVHAHALHLPQRGHRLTMPGLCLHGERPT